MSTNTLSLHESITLLLETFLDESQDQGADSQKETEGVSVALKRLNGASLKASGEYLKSTSGRKVSAERVRQIQEEALDRVAQTVECFSPCSKLKRTSQHLARLRKTLHGIASCKIEKPQQIQFSAMVEFLGVADKSASKKRITPSSARIIQQLLSNKLNLQIMCLPLSSGKTFAPVFGSPVKDLAAAAYTSKIAQRFYLGCHLKHGTPLEEAFNVIFDDAKNYFNTLLYPGAGLKEKGVSRGRVDFAAFLIACDLVYRVCGDNGQGGLCIPIRFWHPSHTLTEATRQLRLAGRPLKITTELYERMPDHYKKRYSKMRFKNNIQDEEKRSWTDPDCIHSVGKVHAMLFEQAGIALDQAEEFAEIAETIMARNPGRQYSDCELKTQVLKEGLEIKATQTEGFALWRDRIASLCLWRIARPQTRYLGRFIWQYGDSNQVTNAADRLNIVDLMDQYFETIQRLATKEEVLQHIQSVRGLGRNGIYNIGTKLQRLNRKGKHTLVWSSRINVIQPGSKTYQRLAEAILPELSGGPVDAKLLKERMIRVDESLGQISDVEFCSLIHSLPELTLNITGTPLEWTATVEPTAS